MAWNLNIIGSKERVFVPKGEKIELVSKNDGTKEINYKGICAWCIKKDEFLVKFNHMLKTLNAIMT